MTTGATGTAPLGRGRPAAAPLGPGAGPAAALLGLGAEPVAAGGRGRRVYTCGSGGTSARGAGVAESEEAARGAGVAESEEAARGAGVAGAARGVGVAESEGAARGAGIAGAARGAMTSGWRTGVGRAARGASDGKPGVPPSQPAWEEGGPMGGTLVVWSVDRSSRSVVDGGVLERGKEASSKTTCLEMIIRFDNRSRHRYPL